MSECPKCEGFGSVCLECRLELGDCECGADAKPWKCEECHGTGAITDQGDLFGRDVCTFPDCDTDCPGRQPAEIAA